jgi:hypothetical protein
MKSLPEPHKIRIEIDEDRPAETFLGGVRVFYRGDIGREALPYGLKKGGAELATHPKGHKAIIPRQWRRLRFGSGTSFYDCWRRGEDIGGDLGPFSRGVEYAEDLLRRNGRDQGSYTADEWTKLVYGALQRLEKCADADDDLLRFLIHGEPHKNRAEPALKDPTLAVQAAVLAELFSKDGRRLTDLDIAGVLGISAGGGPGDEARKRARTAQRYRSAGQALVRSYFGEQVWAGILSRIEDSAGRENS